VCRFGAGKMELDREAAEKRAAWEQLSAQSKITTWLVRHQYSIMFGGWLGACAIAGSIIWKNKWVDLATYHLYFLTQFIDIRYQTGPQKVCKASRWVTQAIDNCPPNSLCKFVCGLRG
jgi:hypothetical protein